MHVSKHFLHLVHFSSFTNTKPSSFLSKASVGQLSKALHGLQCQQTIGKSSPNLSSFITVILEIEEPNAFSLLKEHTISHSPHPEQRSTSTNILFNQGQLPCLFQILRRDVKVRKA